jgi:hypothetical protein
MRVVLLVVASAFIVSAGTAAIYLTWHVCERFVDFSEIDPALLSAILACVLFAWGLKRYWLQMFQESFKVTPANMILSTGLVALLAAYCYYGWVVHTRPTVWNVNSANVIIDHWLSFVVIHSASIVGFAWLTRVPASLAQTQLTFEKSAALAGAAISAIVTIADIILFNQHSTFLDLSVAQKWVATICWSGALCLAFAIERLTITAPPTSIERVNGGLLLLVWAAVLAVHMKIALSLDAGVALPDALLESRTQLLALTGAAGLILMITRWRSMAQIAR